MIKRTRRRRGMTLLEFAIVCPIALLFLFGIFEYARFVFLNQVMENAAREGARFASVRTGDGTTTQQVIDEVNHRMSTRQKELTGYTVEVLNVDPNTGLPVPNTTWDQSAFGKAIMVRIKGTYKPMLPWFLGSSNSLNLKATAMMSSEAN